MSIIMARILFLAVLFVAVRAIAALTTMQQAGSRVIHSYAGLSPPQSLLDAISSGYSAGVIFFGENVGSSTCSYPFSLNINLLTFTV